MEQENFIENDVEFENITIDEEEFVTEESSSAPISSIISYKPLEENLIICQISPAKFDSFLKVLNVLVTDKSSNDSLIIKGSMVTQNISSAIVSSNIEDVLMVKKLTYKLLILRNI